MITSMFLLCALSGAIHVLAPDHWIPFSVASWQRGYDLKTRARFLAAASAIHVISGFVIFLVFSQLAAFSAFTPSRMLALSFFVVALGLAWRISRFRRMREVFLAGPENGRGLVTAMKLLGPCEYLLPILLKTSAAGAGSLLPTLLFGVGTWGGMLGLVSLGQALWNRPLALPRGMSWGERPEALLPALVFLAVGFGAFF